MKKAGAPNFEQLIEWLEGRLPEDEARLVTRQVAADEAVQADVAWLRKFYQASGKLVSAEPPAAVTERLEQRFAAFARDRRRPSRWQRLVATLSFDSQAQLVRGVRAAGAPESQRQLVYETDLATVICTLQGRAGIANQGRANYDERFDLLGQIIPTQERRADMVRVLLLQETEEFDSTITDDLGEFTLVALPGGLYDLVLRGDQYEITIFSLDLSL